MASFGEASGDSDPMKGVLHRRKNGLPMSESGLTRSFAPSRASQ
jgi:hypothetical protein